ncbi:MAG TPA: class I adenylate-forming enzyme family protein, partial [Bacillota bacterium]|nr:class I adenylate-forming enzyme family protein [Bacillota bacterium]
ASMYPDEIAIIMYTSGSTGQPKGVMLSHDHLLRCAYSTCYSRAIEQGRITFAALPFYHCFAIVEGLLAMSFVGGALISANRFSPLSALEQMEKYQVNDFLCVPSMLIPLLNEPSVKDFDLTHLFAMWCGAAPAPATVWQKAQDILGMTEIITGYGQTEVTSSGVTTEIGDSIERIVSRVGRPKLGGIAGLAEFNGSTVEYKTIDPETGEDLSNGMIGEFAVRGNTVTHGYYNKPLETAATIDKDGWLRTGDVGIIDENGYLEHLGRSNDLYKVSGELVAPREVEEVIVKHPAVNQVFIVGVPDRITTEAGAAFIELKSGESIDRKEIIDWCKEKVSRFKIPRHVLFIEPSDWPMTSTGKVQKFRLEAMAKERLNIDESSN